MSLPWLDLFFHNACPVISSLDVIYCTCAYLYKRNTTLLYHWFANSFCVTARVQKYSTVIPSYFFLNYTNVGFVRNKAVYTAALIADGLAGAENLKTVFVTDGHIDGRMYEPTDQKAAYRITCPRIKTWLNNSMCYPRYLYICHLKIKC